MIALEMMKKTKILIFIGFFTACLGIILQTFKGFPLSYQLLAIGFVLLAIDQARMAVIDLDQIAIVRSQVGVQVGDQRLLKLYYLTIFTIILELSGFYLAWSRLGWGIEIVLLSQVIFNALATIQLQPILEPPIAARSWQTRSPILVGNLLAMVLVGLWMREIAPMTITLAAWGIAIAYILGKFVLKWDQKNGIKSV
jgi:hypothetical protein